MKKSIFNLTILATTAFLPLLTVAACASNNQDSSNNQPKTEYEISFKQGPFALGNSDQATKDVDQIELANLIIKNNQQIFNQNHVPANFDWAHNLSLSEIIKNPKQGAINFNLKLTNADHKGKIIEENISITGFKIEANQEQIISYISFKNESGLYTINNQSNQSVTTLDETQIKQLIIENKDLIFTITGNNFDLEVNLEIKIVARDAIQGQISIEVKVNNADSAKQSLEAPIILQGFLEEADQTSDLDKAWNQAISVIEQNQSHYSGTIPSLFKIEELPKLLAKQNFGFTTQISDSDSKTANNDADGIKTVKITIKRNNEEKTDSYQIKGFLNTVEFATEQSDPTKPSNYFNSDSNLVDSSKSLREITVKTTKPETDITKIKTTEELLKIINVEPDSINGLNSGGFNDPFNSLLKKSLATDVELAFQDIKQLEVNGISVEALEAKVQLSSKTGNKKSGFYKLKVVGFKDSEQKLQTIDNLKKLALNYVTIDSPLKVEQSGYATQLASAINTKELLIEQFDQNYGSYNGINVEIIDLIANTADDQKGALKVKFRFNWKDTNLEIEQNLWIYGFKIS